MKLAPDAGTDAPVVPTVLPGLTWWSPHLTRGSSSLGRRSPGCCYPAENQGSHSKPSAPQALQVLPISVGALSNLNPRYVFLRLGKIATTILAWDQGRSRFPDYNSNHLGKQYLDIFPMRHQIFGLHLPVWRCTFSLASTPTPPGASLTTSTSASSPDFLHLP